MRRNIKRKFIATLCAVTMIVGNMSISTYADDAALKITKQPTADNPTVTVNKDDATYQWYKAVEVNEYDVAELAGTIVDGEILAATNEDNYTGDGVWTDATSGTTLEIGMISGDIIKVTPQDGCDITAKLPGMGVTFTDDGTGVLVYESTSDVITSLYIYSVAEAGISAKVEIVRDGVTYPVVNGMKEVVDGAICAGVNIGSYDVNDEDWNSDSQGELAFYIYLKENQCINFNMDDIEMGTMSISSQYGYVNTTIPSNGVYSYSVLGKGYYYIRIENGISFDGSITVSDIERGQAVTGQTTDTLTTFEEGEMYSCLVTCGEEEVWSDFINGTLAIKTQPTVGNPTVELNYDVDVTYQWYGIATQMYTVVDSDEPADDEMQIDYIYGGSYSDGTWYSEDYDDYWCIDACVIASEGDKVVITLPDDFDGIVYDYDTDYEFTYNNGAYEYTIIESDGYINFTIESSEEFTADIQVGVSDIGDAIEGETKATLQNYEYGKTYVCKILTEDDVEMVSDFVDMQFVISSQPTATNPAVEVNFPDMVSKYQWYEFELAKYEVIDESMLTSDDASDVIGAEAGDGVYEDGAWTAEAFDMGGAEGYNIVVLLEAEEGDLIKMVPSTENIVQSILIVQNTYDFLEYENGVYYVEAKSSGEFTIGLLASEEFTAEITVERTSLCETVENQTANKLTNHEAGDYICEITLSDDTVLLSNVVSITEADITHTYTDEYDADCNDCGATRVVPESETETTTGTDGSGTGTGTDSGAGTVSPNTADGVDMMLILLLACAGIAGALLTPVFNKKRYQ